MDHFYESIEGWFDFDNIYKSEVNKASDGAHFVEVGTWKGRSAAFMCVEIANSNKKIKFDCVDIWTGADGYNNDRSVQKNTLYEDFLVNMAPVAGLFTPVREWSDKAAVLYQDESLDFVFIDAGHTYEAVLADIKAWLPKVKPGGVLAGHDYNHAAGVRQAVKQMFTNFSQDRSSWVMFK